MANHQIVLNNGLTMPTLGLGTWLPDPFPGVTGPGVENAIRIGFRHIDCAFIYQNEDEVGEAIENVLKEGVVKREDLFITSKLWGCYHHPDDVETACRESLQRLRLEYVDLFLIHTPFAIQRGEMFASETTALGYDENSINETWKAMEKLVPLGLAKSIGVSNFTITKLEALLPNTTICPAVNQIESNPQFVQSKLREYCKKKGIKVISYSPLGSPGRLDKVDNEVDILTDATVNEIATAHNITPAQVCISYMLHLGDGTIPKSMDEGHLKENYEVLNIQLTSDEIDKLKKLDSGFRRNTYDWIYFSKFASDEAAWDVEADSKFVFN